MGALTLYLSVLILGYTAPAKTSLGTEVEVRILALQAADLLVNEYLITGDERQAALDAYLTYSRKSLDVPVYLVPLMKDTHRQLLGLCSCPQTMVGKICIIFVDNSVSKSNAQLSTLLHEIAHTLHGDHVKTSLEGEIWAETIGWLVQRELGYDTTRESLSYLAHVPSEQRRRFLDEKEPYIRKAVAKLVKVGRKSNGTPTPSPDK